MTKEETLKSVLATACGVSVYPLEKKSTDNNCITYRLISSRPTRTHTGKDSLIRQRYLIGCYGRSYDEAKTLGDLVFNALEVNTSDFEVCTCEDMGNETKEISTNLYKRELQFFVW